MASSRHALGLSMLSLMLACTSNAKFTAAECDPCRAGPLGGDPACPGTCGPGPAGSGGGGDGGGGGSAGSGGAGSGGAPVGGVTLRVANFNVQNLFDAVDGGGFGETELTPTPAEYARRIDDAAALLTMLNADVIVLEEIENRAVVLADLADKLEEKRGVLYPSRWLITGNDSVRNLALLSSLPVDEGDVVSHNPEGNFDALGELQAGGPFSFARDCLEVTIRQQGYAVTFFAIHYKAKSNDDPARRLAEARRTRRLVDARFLADPDARVVVLGDFNDTPGSPPLLALTSPTPPLSSGVSLLPAEQAWTHPFGTPNQLIDDQLASPSLAAARLPDTVTVLHDYDPGFPEGLRRVSDHAPVAVTYRLGDGPLGP